MTRDRSAALLLTAGTMGTLITMAFHPTGSEALQDAVAGGTNWRARAVHALAIAMLPLLLVGFLGLTARLRESRDMAIAAFVTASLATGAVLVAAVASGLLAPDVIGDIAEVAGSQQALLLQQLHFVGAINQAFAKVYVALMGGALLLWSLAMRATVDFPRALSALGLAVGAAEIVGVLSGHLHFGVHGFGLVVLVQGVWVLWAAVVLARPRP